MSTNITVVDIDVDISKYPIKHVHYSKDGEHYLFEVVINNKILHYVVPKLYVYDATTPLVVWLHNHPEWLVHPMELDFCDYTQIDTTYTPKSFNTSSPTCVICGSSIHDMYCGECDSLALGV